MSHIRKLLFLHIPKTAGLSIHSQLQSAFASSKTIRFGDDSSLRKFKNMTHEELNEFDYITGHFTLSQARAKGIVYPTVVILRRPVDRLVSMYRYLNQSDHPDHVRLKFDDFSRFIEYIDRTPMYHNLQCRYLCENGKHVNAIEAVKNENLYIAPLEYLDEFLQMLSSLLNTKIENVVKNASKEKKDEGKMDVSKLAPFVDEDESLYDFVTNNFSKIEQDFLQSLES